jgi:sulfonate transport system substrate-binding protein
MTKVKSQSLKIFRRLSLFIVPGLLTLGASLTLVNVTVADQSLDRPTQTKVPPASNTISNLSNTQLAQVSDTQKPQSYYTTIPNLGVVKIAQAGNKRPPGVKANVIRIGFQQAGDLVRNSGAIERRLTPLGVKVEWAQFAQGPQLMEAMNVGRVDIGSVGETPPIFAQAAGARLVYLVGTRRTANTGRSSIIAVPPNSPIRSVRDLKGKTVIFQRASASQYFIAKALEEVGLKYSDIKVQSLPTVDSYQPFLEGKIPVWVAGDPYYALAEKLGKIRVIRNAQGIATPGSYYVGDRKFAVENPGILRIVIEEIDKVQRQAEANPKETAQTLVKYQKLPEDVARRVVSRRTFGLRGISENLIREQQEVADYFFKLGSIPKRINIREATLTPQEYAAITPRTIPQR